jgi:hypothetical protein
MKDALEKGSKDAQGAKVFKLGSIEQQVLDHFYTSAEGALLFARRTMSSTTGRSRASIDSQEIIAGDGIIPQYEEYAQYINYSNGDLRLKDFQDAIENVCDKRGRSMGNHITVICNRIFSRHKAQALIGALNTFTISSDGAWFYSRDLKVPNDPDGLNKVKVDKFPNDIAIGATLNTYIYEGNTITFVVDEALTRHYQDRGFAIFIDSGVYETENGQMPSISLKTLKGRALVKNYITGMGGIDGKSNGLVSNASDSGRFEVLGWRGVCVQNPFSATIIEEIV